MIRELAERFQPQGMLCSTQGLRYGLARLAATEAGPDGADAPPPVDPETDQPDPTA